MNKLLAGASIFCVGMVLFGINRGFDFSDEGFYVFLANPFQENKAGIFNYDLYFKLFYRFTGYSFSLVELRILRLMSYLSAAWALAVFWKNISGDTKISWDIFWISCLGIFMGYAFLPPTLSYNSLTVVLICFWLNFISKEELTVKSLLLFGIILATLVYVKITLALLFLPLTFLFLVFCKKIKPLRGVVLILPVFLLELLFLVFLKENAWLRLVEGIPLNSERSGYQIGFMIKSMVVGGFWSVLTATLFFFLGYFKRLKSSYYPPMQIVTGFSVLVIGYLTHITDEWNHIPLLLAAAFLGFQLGIKEFQPDKINLWILFLLILPFLLHFGSNVYWLRIGIHYLVFWILALTWILKNQSGKFQLVVSAFTVLLVFNGIWWHPFRHEKPLWSQKEEWKIGEREVLQIDPDLATIASQLNKFQAEHTQSQLIAAYRIPGLVWLSGTTHPFSPGIWELNQLNALFEDKPQAMIYNKLQDLPRDWHFKNSQDLGAFRSDTLLLLWD